MAQSPKHHEIETLALLREAREALLKQSGQTDLCYRIKVKMREIGERHALRS